MVREEDKHRAAEYVPTGPIQIAERGALIDALKRIAVLEEQVKSIQMSLTRGIAKAPADLPAPIKVTEP